LAPIFNGLAAAPRQPYLAPMSFFPRPSSPRAALSDLVSFLRHREREHVIGAALAILVTIIIVIEFVVDSKVNTAPPPEVVEVQLYPANRTDADIIRDQKKDMAEREAAKKADQEQYKQLAKQLHID
jgi:hypothetical protein